MRTRIAVAHALLSHRACLITLAATACGRTAGPLGPLADGTIDRAGNFDGTVLCLDQMLARFTTVDGLATDGSSTGGLDGVAGFAGRPVRPVTELTIDRALLHVARLRGSRARGRARVALAVHDTSLCAIATVFGASAPITNLPNGGSGEVALLLGQQFTTCLSTTSGKLLDRADALLYATADRLSAL